MDAVVTGKHPIQHTQLAQLRWKGSTIQLEPPPADSQALFDTVFGKPHTHTRELAALCHMGKQESVVWGDGDLCLRLPGRVLGAWKRDPKRDATLLAVLQPPWPTAGSWWLRGGGTGDKVTCVQLPWCVLRVAPYSHVART